MTRESYNKHKEAIDWFYSQPEGTEILVKGGCSWTSTIEPAWDVNTKYVINDVYSTFRKALADGKTIESKIDYGCCGSYSVGDSVPWTVDDTGRFVTDLQYYREKQDITYPAYFRELSSDIIVRFDEELKGDQFGTVVEGLEHHVQKQTGFTWRCWDTFDYPERWEYLPEYKPKQSFKIGDWVMRSNKNFTIHGDENANKVVKVNENTITLETYSGCNIDYKSEHIKPWKPTPGEWIWGTTSSGGTPRLVKLSKLTTDGNAICSTELSDSTWATVIYTNYEPYIGELPSYCKD
jgi:hypothetical protein